MWAAGRVSPERRVLRARSPEADIARVRDPGAPRTRSSALPLVSLAASRRCFQTCCAWIGGAGAGPGAPKPGGEWGEPRDRRECVRAARGSPGGRGAGGSSGEFAASDPGEGRLSPPLPCGGGQKAIRRPEHNAPLRRIPGREGTRGQVAESPKSLPLPAGSGPSRASVATSVKWGRGLLSRSPSCPGSRRSSRDPTCWARSVPGLRRPGWPGPEAAGCLRTHGRGAGRRRTLQDRPSGQGDGSFPWRPRPWPARPAGPRSPPLGTPPVRGADGRCGAAVAVAKGGALPPTAGRGRPRPPAGPARPFRLLRASRAGPILGSPGRPALSRVSRLALGPVNRVSASPRYRFLRELLCPRYRRALCTGVNERVYVHVCMGTCVPRRYVRVRPTGCRGFVCRHADCHTCAPRCRSGVDVRPEWQYSGGISSPLGRFCAYVVQEADLWE